MPLTPLDIHNKEFRHTFRGYDPQDVDDFLDLIIHDYEELIRENGRLKDQATELAERIDEYENMKESLEKALVVAQNTAEELKQNAKKEGELIIKEAEMKADQIVYTSMEKARRIEEEYQDLRQRFRGFQSRLKKLLEAQLEMLENGDWFEEEEVVEG